MERRQLEYMKEQEEATTHLGRQRTWEAQNNDKSLRPTYQDSKVGTLGINCLFMDSKDQCLYKFKDLDDSIITMHRKLNRSNYC